MTIDLEQFQEVFMMQFGMAEAQEMLIGFAFTMGLTVGWCMAHIKFYRRQTQQSKKLLEELSRK